MTRRLLGLLVSAPLLAAGWLAAHELAYRVTLPSAGERRHALLTSGHGYLDTAHVVTAGALALALVALVICTVWPTAGYAGNRSVPVAFALIPPLGFVTQEHVERLIHDGSLSPDIALAPSFIVGIVLQVPIAAAAVLFAHALLTIAHTVGKALTSLGSVRTTRAPRTSWPRAVATPPTASPLALHAAVRAPPLPSRR